MVVKYPYALKERETDLPCEFTPLRGPADQETFPVIAIRLKYQLRPKGKHLSS
jgi:hypothetical protein